MRNLQQAKPAADMFLRAAGQLGVEPSEAVVVEDAIAGIQAGREGGFGLVAGVARKRAADQLRQAGADVAVHDLRQLDAASPATQAANRPQTRPTAIEHVDRIGRWLHDRELALFSDYDGTLTPIVRRPEEAALSEDVRSLLQALSERSTVAIVSGRDRADVEQMVQLDGLAYAGSHGFDIRGPGIEMEHEGAKRALPELDEAEREARARIEPIQGARVERKRFAVAVHYREITDDSDVRRVEQAVDEIRAERLSLRKKGGKKIFELQPDVAWDKGRAILWLEKELGLDAARFVLIYIGDDVTDEDAFRVLQDREAGVGIRVAPPTGGTQASYWLRDCEDVRQFLQSLLGILQETEAAKP
jgi:alpha,alpha-trehalase